MKKIKLILIVGVIILLTSSCKKKCYYCEKNGSRVSPTVCPEDASFQTYKNNCDWANGFWLEEK